MPFRDRLAPYKSNLLHELGELLLYGSHEFLFLRGNLEGEVLWSKTIPFFLKLVPGPQLVLIDVSSIIHSKSLSR